jgi:cell division protein FtsW (lipid II flippase)
MNLMKETLKTVLQVLVGLVLWVAIGVVLIYSSLPVFWEHEERLQFHVYPITWRSGLLAVLLLVVTQVISFLLFRRIRWRNTRTPDTHMGNL